jgi:hypothetical protein
MTKETNNQATSVSSRRQDVIIVPLYFLLGFFPNGFGIWEGVVKLLFFFVEARHISPRGRPKQRKREKEKEKKRVQESCSVRTETSPSKLHDECIPECFAGNTGNHALHR